uniref:SH2 domain containing 2A n=1 Tax=Chelydra serpentina TaxID=8475 RepID=A0A8C3XL92_CHESE
MPGHRSLQEPPCLACPFPSPARGAEILFPIRVTRCPDFYRDSPDFGVFFLYRLLLPPTPCPDFSHLLPGHPIPELPAAPTPALPGLPSHPGAAGSLLLRGPAAWVGGQGATQRWCSRPMGPIHSGAVGISHPPHRVGFSPGSRGRDRCRHFILDQLEDECYVILGEDSAHTELQGLLQHYTTAPVTPYYEFLTAPCPRVRERLTRTEAGSGAPPEPASVPPAADGHAYSLVLKQPQAPSSPGQEAGASVEPYAHVSKAPGPAERPTPAQPAEAKYQQLMRFHTYAEPRGGFPPPERRIYYEPDEPIPFYAMGRGSLPGPDPENVYAEVELARRAWPQAPPRVLQNTAATLPRGSSRPPAEPAPGHRRLLRSMSGQGSRRRRLPAALAVEGGQGRPSGPSSEVGATGKDKWGAAL